MSLKDTPMEWPPTQNSKRVDQIPADGISGETVFFLFQVANTKRLQEAKLHRENLQTYTFKWSEITSSFEGFSTKLQTLCRCNIAIVVSSVSTSCTNGNRTRTTKCSREHFSTLPCSSLEQAKCLVMIRSSCKLQRSFAIGPCTITTSSSVQQQTCHFHMAKFASYMQGSF